jgi:hypothetical protein
MPRSEKSAGADLERLDEQLLNVHVQLTKLDVLVDMAARNADAVRVIARRIDAIGRSDAGQQNPLPRDIHKNCG